VTGRSLVALSLKLEIGERSKWSWRMSLCCPLDLPPSAFDMPYDGLKRRHATGDLARGEFVETLREVLDPPFIFNVQKLAFLHGIYETIVSALAVESAVFWDTT